MKSFIFVFALSLFSISYTAYSQITQPTAWTKAYDQTSGTCAGVSFPVASGSNRILIVGISHTLSSSATQANPTTISYGGVTLTLATTTSATNGRQHTWFYYLKDNAVMDNTSRPLNVTLGSSHLNVTVWYAVFAGVDQTPGTYTTGNGFNNTPGIGPCRLSAAMTVNANEQAVYYSCINNTTDVQPPIYTTNANWTVGGTSSGSNSTTSNWRNQVAKRNIPGATVTDNATTSNFDLNCRYSMSAMSLPRAAAVSPTFTITNPTTSVGAATACGSYVKFPIHAFNVTGSGSTGTLTNFQFTTSGTYVAADITNFKIWWNSSNNLTTATLLATNSTPSGAGVQTFTAFSLNIPVGTYYFWITADIATSVVTGNTLIVSGSNATDMTTTAIKAGGPTNASGTQTLNASPTAVTVSGGGTFCGGTTTLNATGGSGGTIYFQGTNTGGTSTATPSISQTVATNGTYYFRSYDGTTCWGPEGSASVTISTVPTAVTVSGSGTFCGSTTITASGGSGGTIYWQNTNSGGTSTATPSVSQTVSASGTYYFRALNGTCWGPEGSATVMINPVPGTVTVNGGGNYCSVASVTLTASGGSGGTIYWQNNVSNGTSTATPSVSQAVTTSGTYYFRAQSAAGCWGTQASAVVTIGTTPTAVTVSGGGTFCGTSATLTASGGVGGTIYWQNTTPNGTSTTTASSSQTVAASGTYYFRARDAGSCWSTQGFATVVLNPVPAITLGTNPSVCSGTTSANLTYSATTGTPNQYSIDYDATANAQGFVDITNGALPTNPIVLVVPAGASAGTYNFNLTVRNSTTGCVSSIYAKTITKIAIPATPGTISGLSAPAPGTAGLVYSIIPVSGATSYSWTVPVGWTITSGAGTTSITVTSGIAGQDGNITVQALNSCGSGGVSTLNVILAVPHNNCNQCHINHNSYGTALAIVSGNANLCISCHNTGGTASTKPFNNAMKAVPGISGTSHTWDANAVNFKYGANLPTDAGMLARLDGGKFLCSTCHNQHSNTFSPYLRVSNDGDAMCKQCHSVRNVGRYIDNPSVNIGSHPVGITYNGSDARFLSTPSSSTPLVNAKVECSSCHKTHYAASNDGYALRMTYTDAICKSCHVWKTSRRSLDHEGMGCITCHIAHKAGNTNIMLVRDTINTPNSGFKAVVFAANSAASNYADAASPFNGICEACHTQTNHYTNTSGGTSDARHVPATQKCTSCHPHDDAFYAQTNCLDCHNAITDKPGVGPLGGRRQIVDASGNGSGAGGDFKRTSHHVSGTVPNVSDCILCHYMGDHMAGTVKLMDPDLGYLNVISYDTTNKSTLEPFCIKCHDADGAGGDLTPFSDNIPVPVINQTMWNASAHKGNVNTNTCLSCHDNGHGSNKSTLIGPSDYTGPGTGTDLMNEEEGFCLGCHGGTGIASVKVHLAFSSYTNTTTRFFKHDPTATYRKHINGENTGAAFGGANRHVECVDCHNPHGAKAYVATTAPTIYNELIGASGVTPSYAGIGSPTGFTFNKNTTYEYEVCYKCHSSFTTLPTYLPDGIINGTTPTYQTDGVRKLTTTANSQVPDWRDMARVFNPANLGYHPVMATGKNTTLNVNTLQTGWTASSRMYCSSCHDNNNNGAGYGRGPHGSSNLHLLDGATNYTTAHGAAPTQTMNCIICHKVASYITGNTNSGFGDHQKHYGENASCYLCHNSHGGEIIHMINFSRNENVACITAMTGTSQSAFIHPTGGYNKSNCLITCHTEVHN